MPRIPLHSGSRLPVVTLPDDARLLAAPPPLDPIADVGAAVVEALRYPLAGEPIAELVPRGGRVTVVAQPLEQPLPTAPDDPRRDALAAVLAELSRRGVPRDGSRCWSPEGSRAVRAGPSSRSSFGPSRPARSADASSSTTARPTTCAARLDGHTARVHPALLDTDLVVTVGAGETVLHGGAGALSTHRARVRSGPRARCRLEITGASGWRLAGGIEREVGRRVPLVGLSLVLDRPRTTGLYRGYPWRRPLEASGAPRFDDC